MAVKLNVQSAATLGAFIGQFSIACLN